MSRRRIGITGIGIMVTVAVALSGTAEAAAILTFTGHTGSVSSVAFSPDGSRVLTGSIYDPAKLWNTATGALIRNFTPDLSVNSVAYSPDGTEVLTASGANTAKLWNAGTGALIRTLAPAPDVTSVAFSPDGTWVLNGSYDKTAKLWDAATGAVVNTFTGHTGAVTSVAFSPDGTEALTGSWDKTAKLWDTTTGALIRTFTGHTGSLSSVTFSPNGSKVLTGAGAPDNSAKLWNASTGDLIQTFNVSSDLSSVAYSPDGTKVLTGSVDKTAKLWDAATGALLLTLTGHTEAVNSVAFSPDGTKALTGSGDKTAKLWAIMVPVPDVTGQTQTVAGFTLTSASLATGAVTRECSNTVASGLVLRQIPSADEQALFGSAVALVVSSGVCNVTVPNVVGQAQAEAAAALADAGLAAGTAIPQCSNTVAAGLVINQGIEAGQQVPFGSPVALVVSSGLCSVPVPNVAGLTQTAAGAALTGASLTTGAVTQQCSNTVAAGLVISQDPAADGQALFGSTVALVVSTGVCNVPVPNVTGLTQAAAGAALTGVGLLTGEVVQQCSNTVAAGLVISQDPPGDQQLLFGSAVALVVSTGVCNVPVPNVTGLTQTAAGSALTGAGLSAGTVTQQCSNIIAAGMVINQFPPADQQAPFGSTVALTVSTGLCNVPVPTVVGQTQAAAVAALNGANLSAGAVTQQCSNTVAAGRVISQVPAAGQQAPFGSAVALVVSTGLCNVTVPGVTGQTQAAAGTALAGAGLVSGGVTAQCSSTVAAGLVISQLPAAGQQAPFGSAVALTVSSGPCAAEGEGEGEGENAPPTETELRNLLTATFDAVDSNGDSQISLAEALAALPDLPETVFNAVDTDGNGQISLTEAGLNVGGCAGCSGGKGAFTPDGMKKALSDLFLGGLSLMALSAIGRHRA